MEVLLFALAVLIAAGGIGIVLYAQRSVRPTATRQRHNVQSESEARVEAQSLIDDAREEAVRLRAAALEEIVDRQNSLDIETSLLENRERQVADEAHHFNQHRHSYKQRRAALDEREAALNERRAELTGQLAQRAEMDSEAAKSAVLAQVENELEQEHSARVESSVMTRLDEPDTESRAMVVQALQRQNQGHTDNAPRTAPIPLEGVEGDARDHLLATLQTIAEETTMELGVDTERMQASLRGQNPIGREIARQAALEVIDRKLQAENVAPWLMGARTRLDKRITDIGERALWEMRMEGRPELAELIGTLHYRFSYGQNALLHCQETGYLCGVLAAELGMEQEISRTAGMLHDIGKAVDHDVEGSHAIIGGELLRVLGTEGGIVHAVKAHHFDEEPSTDLAMLTICADAISASRPGARRDTLASYLARLDQLQTIATRHQGVERAFPLQAGREIRVVVKAKQMQDETIPQLSHDIAREIESEMQYPGVIKVTVIRETTATATAPAQIGAAAKLGLSADSLELGGTTTRRRRRGGKRNRRGNGDGSSNGDGASDNGAADHSAAPHENSDAG